MNRIQNNIHWASKYVLLKTYFGKSRFRHTYHPFFNHSETFIRNQCISHYQFMANKHTAFSFFFSTWREGKCIMHTRAAGRTSMWDSHPLKPPPSGFLQARGRQTRSHLSIIQNSCTQRSWLFHKTPFVTPGSFPHANRSYAIASGARVHTTTAFPLR